MKKIATLYRENEKDDIVEKLELWSRKKLTPLECLKEVSKKVKIEGNPYKMN